MTIKFPKRCKTQRQKSEHASYVASARWSKYRAAQPLPTHIGYIEFGGAMAGGLPLRLDLVAVDGERKWTGITDGSILPDRLSERSIIRLVKAVLRAPRYFALQSPSGFGASTMRKSADRRFAPVCDPLAALISSARGET